MLRSPGLGQHSMGGWGPRTFRNPELMTEPSWASTPPTPPRATGASAGHRGGPLTPAFTLGRKQVPVLGR